jgi:hypothetical protein
MKANCPVAIIGFRSIALWVLLTLLQSAAANAESLFDESKRVILPSEAATTILKWYVADGNWSVTE